MRIERNTTAWIKETPEATYLLVNSIAQHPVYFLAEIFIQTNSGWHALVCAPIDDPKVGAIEAQFEDSNGEFVEIALPKGLPAPLGRTPGRAGCNSEASEYLHGDPDLTGGNV